MQIIAAVKSPYDGLEQDHKYTVVGPHCHVDLGGPAVAPGLSH